MLKKIKIRLFETTDILVELCTIEEIEEKMEEIEEFSILKLQKKLQNYINSNYKYSRDKIEKIENYPIQIFKMELVIPKKP